MAADAPIEGPEVEATAGAEQPKAQQQAQDEKKK